MDRDTQRWFQSHNINLVDCSKRVARYRVDYAFFNTPEDYNCINDRVIHDTEALLVIEIPESDLERIKEFEQQVFNNFREHGHYNLFEIIMEQKEREKYLRNKYPAVENAYKNYSLILKLAESGEL